MKIARFKHKDRLYYGKIEKDSISFIEGDIFSNFKITDKKIKISDVKLTASVNPTKIICVGLNYKDHAKELNMPVPDEPIIFLKPPTAVIGPDEKILYPQGVNRLDYEAELAIVIKKG